MKFSKEKLIEILPKAITNTSGKELTINCPWCNKRECGIAIYKDNHPFQCFRKKNCGATANIYSLLDKIGRKDLIDKSNKEINIFGNVENVIEFEEENEESRYLFSDNEINFPVGFERIYNNSYLKKRLFDKKDFYVFPVGKTDIGKKHKNYLLFVVYERNLLKGYVGRYNKTKIPENKPKYINSTGFDSESLLYNFDSIDENTNTVILVEGIMDCVNITKLLDYDNSVVCCATFGAKLSKKQIQKLQYKNIENLILLYDPDVVNKIKKISYDLLKSFNIYVGDLQNCDPGELSEQSFCYLLDNLYSPLDYFISKVNKNI